MFLDSLYGYLTLESGGVLSFGSGHIYHFTPTLAGGPLYGDHYTAHDVIPRNVNLPESLREFDMGQPISISSETNLLGDQPRSLWWMEKFGKPASMDEATYLVKGNKMLVAMESGNIQQEDGSTVFGPMEALRQRLEGFSHGAQFGEAQTREHIQEVLDEFHTITISQNGQTQVFEVAGIDWLSHDQIQSLQTPEQLLTSVDTPVNILFCSRSYETGIEILTQHASEIGMEPHLWTAYQTVQDPKANEQEFILAVKKLAVWLKTSYPTDYEKFSQHYNHAFMADDKFAWGRYILRLAPKGRYLTEVMPAKGPM